MIKWFLKVRKFKEEDDKMKAQVDAKNELESYTYQLKSAADDDKNALEETDRTQLKEKVDEVMKWLETAQNAEKEEIDSMKKELEDIAKPIMRELYGAAGEGGGYCLVVMPGGMPGWYAWWLLLCGYALLVI